MKCSFCENKSDDVSAEGGKVPLWLFWRWWLGFFVGFVLIGGCTGEETFPQKSPQSSQAQQFRAYVEVVRRQNEANPGTEVTGDEATRTIVIRQKFGGKAADLANVKERFKAATAKSAVFRQDLVQIRELGITMVYRLETADGKTVDIAFAPSDWDGME